MKDTDHPIRHLRVHPGDRANAQARESCARQNGQDGRGMAPSWAGATPLLHTLPWPRVILGVAPAHEETPPDVLPACVAEFLVETCVGIMANKVKTVPR